MHPVLHIDLVIGSEPYWEDKIYDLILSGQWRPTGFQEPQRIGSKSVRIDRRVKSTEEEERVVRLREMQKCQNLSFDNLQYFLNKGVRNNKFRK